MSKILSFANDFLTFVQCRHKYNKTKNSLNKGQTCFVLDDDLQKDSDCDLHIYTLIEYSGRCTILYVCH